MKHEQFFTKSALSLALGLAFAQSASAQQAAEPAEKIQRVEITGSSIKRTAAEAAGSIQVLGRDDIARTGETTALGILNSSAAIGTDISSANSSSGSFATGSSGAGMRGLGKVATLVLVNGRRIAQYGLSDGAQQNFTNLDAIPAAAIDRIEILKDGASAIYGSDAIAGVINIILMKDYVGAEINGNYKQADGFRDMRNRSVSGKIGWGDIDANGFNTYLTYEAYKSDGFTTDDLRNHVPAWHRLTPGRSTWDNKSTYAPTGNYFLSSTNIVAAPGCPANAVDPVDKQCKLDVLPYTGLTTDAKRYALASNTHFRIGKAIDANFELTYASASNDYIVAPLSTNNGGTTTSTNIWYDVYGGKMVGPFSYPKLPVGHPNNPYATPVEYRARLMDTGDGFNFNRTESDQYRAMLALTGAVAGWDWKSAFGHMESNATKATRAVSAKGYTDAIVNGSYKFGQKNDSALLEKMFPVRTTVGHARITFFDATVSGEVAQLPAGPLAVAVGTDIRREAYEMKSSDNVLSGELVGIFGLQVKDTVDHYAVFTEATIPVVKQVELSAALRADKTSNSEAHVSPKLGLRYNVTDGLLLRATAAGGFRAPNIVESGNGLGRSAVTTSVVDPRRCPIANQLNTLIQNSGATAAEKALANTYRGNDCAGSLPSFAQSNPDLKPETSRSITAGFVIEPVKNWTAALDYFHIERKDEIGTRSTTDILKGEAALPAGQLVRIDNTVTDNEFLALVNKYVPGNTTNFGGVGKLGMLYNPYVNSGRTRASGFDFDASGRFDTGLGQVRMKLEGAYLWKYQAFSVADNAYGPNQAGMYVAGNNTFTSGYQGLSRLNTKLRLYLKSGNFDNGVTLNYRSGYSNNDEASPTYCATQKVAAEYLDTCGKVGSNTTVDYNLAYTGIRNVKLGLYIDNIFQMEAPVQWRDGYQPQFRKVGFSANYKFF
ncbi:TonB-dependent receptor domain-containing protein [Duganella callida]|uniref:TonB-dependent receptor n=1 Tax=Duganella callida TaxID=2561932 RepID=A0A4Y9RWC1_9BURK|nr:TonB-dependent receptor [Duganella callida]TFW11588.1 TonB-dependent receptor [Duganella callida]